MKITFSIWIASKTRWAHLEKDVDMPVIPRVGEYMKFSNAVVGDYFSWKISQITYKESGEVDVWTGLLEDSEGCGYSFDAEDEFDEYYASYVNEGWRCERGQGKNRRYKAGK